jgi:hypothetical protein
MLSLDLFQVYLTVPLREQFDPMARNVIAAQHYNGNKHSLSNAELRQTHIEFIKSGKSNSESVADKFDEMFKDDLAESPSKTSVRIDQQDIAKLQELALDPERIAARQSLPIESLNELTAHIEKLSDNPDHTLSELARYTHNTAKMAVEVINTEETVKAVLEAPASQNLTAKDREKVVEEAVIQARTELTMQKKTLTEQEPKLPEAEKSINDPVKKVLSLNERRALKLKQEAERQAKAAHQNDNGQLAKLVDNSLIDKLAESGVSATKQVDDVRSNSGVGAGNISKKIEHE